MGTHVRVLGLKNDVQNHQTDSDVTERRSSEKEKHRTRTRQEEGVVLVSGRVLLGLEQGVKVPERALYEVVGGHLSEAAESTESI